VAIDAASEGDDPREPAAEGPDDGRLRFHRLGELQAKGRAVSIEVFEVVAEGSAGGEALGNAVLHHSQGHSRPCAWNPSNGDTCEDASGVVTVATGRFPAQGRE